MKKQEKYLKKINKNKPYMKIIDGKIVDFQNYGEEYQFMQKRTQKILINNKKSYKGPLVGVMHHSDRGDRYYQEVLKMK